MWKPLIFAKMNLTLICKPHFEGSMGVTLFELIFCHFVLLCLSMCLHSFKKIHHNTNGRFWSFLFCFAHLDQILLTEKELYHYFLNSYCDFVTARDGSSLGHLRHSLLSACFLFTLTLRVACCVLCCVCVPKAHLQAHGFWNFSLIDSRVEFKD